MSSPDPFADAPPSPPTYNSPPAIIAFTLAILILCFVAFSFVYLCKYCFVGILHTWFFQRSASDVLSRLSPNRSPPRGLDPLLLQNFPTFLYSSVKELRKDKYSLECAICLLEFEDNNMIRLLSLCCHVFHQECIDLWLQAHKTCPVCRRELDEVRKSGDINCHCHNLSQESIRVSLNSSNHICIDIREEGGEEEHQRYEHEHQHEHENGFVHPACARVRQQMQEEHKFGRSHSTGHSIVKVVNEEEKQDDKYTLRLPEQFITIRGRHNISRSCATFKEITRNTQPCRNCGFVETVSGSSSISLTT